MYAGAKSSLDYGRSGIKKGSSAIDNSIRPLKGAVERIRVIA